MENVQTAAPPVSAPPRRRPFFIMGALLFFLGLGIYIVQFSLKQFVVPWYVPILGTIGVLFMAVSVWQRQGILPRVLRSIGLVVFVLLCGFEWFIVLASKTPVYTGPAQPGCEIPAFSTTLPDGSSFTDKDLEKGMPTVLIFNRGRW